MSQYKTKMATLDSESADVCPEVTGQSKSQLKVICNYKTKMCGSEVLAVVYFFFIAGDLYTMHLVCCNLNAKLSSAKHI